MPAVIAEIAYLSNASDRELLKQDEFRQKAAHALADSVFEALEVMGAEKDEDGVWKIKKVILKSSELLPALVIWYIIDMLIF